MGTKEYERVYTVTNYWDGPREGIADFNGQPHVYKSIFDNTNDEYSDTFLLTPIDQLSLQLALEDWEIWLRWKSAFNSGRVNIDSHPALPEDRSRHREISEILAARLATLSDKSIYAKGHFRKRLNVTSQRNDQQFEVLWISLPT